MRTVCLLAAGLVLACLTPCKASETDDSASSLPASQQVETQILEYLNAGEQTKAEILLDAQTVRYPDILQFISLKPSQLSKSGERLLALAARYSDKQRLLFLLAACRRSRFDIEGAIPIFGLVYECGRETTAGKCALHVLHLDSGTYRQRDKKAIDSEFADFGRLADANPEDTIVRWMVAVQCRSWNRNEEGVEHYRKILQKWNPGPVLVHQTYANLLDQVKQFDEALIERRKAVEMEPAGWSYDGMANTLHNMGRLKEATEAHIRAVRLNPTRSSYWSNWASTLFSEGNYAEAIAMSKRAIELNTQDRLAWKIWGKSLTWQGHVIDAAFKYKEANVVLYGKNKL